MGEARGIAFRWLCAAVLLCSVWMVAQPACAQNTIDDAAAREQFKRGSSAFEETDYEEALRYLRRAYELSGRGQLQYNIGVTATRLQRDEEALEAFESYLSELTDPPREEEVRSRIAALERSIEEAKALAAPVQEPVGRRVPKSAIIGSSILGAVGVAGATVLGLGLARSGECVEEMGGICTMEEAPSPWTWVYGAVGVAALAGSVSWLVVSSKRNKEKRSTAWMLTPTGVMVSGSF